MRAGRSAVRRYLVYSGGIASATLGLAIIVSFLAVSYTSEASSPPASGDTAEQAAFTTTESASVANPLGRTRDARFPISLPMVDGPAGNEPDGSSEPLASAGAPASPTPNVSVEASPTPSPQPTSTESVPSSTPTAQPAPSPSPSPTRQRESTPTPSPTPKPRETATPVPEEPSEPSPPAQQLAVASIIEDVNLTFYDCAGQGFCGAMYNGEQVYEGAAACSWNLPIGTAFYILGDPTGRVYVCKDRGLLANTWVDIFWYEPAMGYAWQSIVGRYGVIAIVALPQS